jgi:hypothetical protein
MHLQRSVLALLVGAVAILLVGVVIAVAASRQSETTYPPGTPEATIADFIRLVEGGKLDEAYVLTDIAGLTRERFNEQFDPAFTGDSSRRVTLVRTNVNGSTATVVVAISTFSDSDSLDVSEYTNRQTYRLRLENGRWLITGPSYFGL